MDPIFRLDGVAGCSALLELLETVAGGSILPELLEAAENIALSYVGWL